MTTIDTDTKYQTSGSEGLTVTNSQLHTEDLVPVALIAYPKNGEGSCVTVPLTRTEAEATIAAIQAALDVDPNQPPANAYETFLSLEPGDEFAVQGWNASGESRYYKVDDDTARWGHERAREVGTFKPYDSWRHKPADYITKVVRTAAEKFAELAVGDTFTMSAIRSVIGLSGCPEVRAMKLNDEQVYIYDGAKVEPFTYFHRDRTLTKEDTK